MSSCQNLTATQVIDCLQRRRAVPRTVLEWRSAAEGCGYEIKLWKIIASLCSLRKDEKEQKIDASTMIGLAASIDANLAGWVNNLPWEYSYMTRTKGRAEYLFCGYYHVYTSARKALVWNSYRSARILVNETILNLLASESTSQALGAEQCLAAQTLINQLSNEICASVLFQLWGDYPMQNSSYIPKAAAGYALLWPLYLVGLYGQPYLTRSWVIAQLDKIGDLMGILQATSLANLLRMDKEIKVWDTMTMNNAIEELAEEEDDW